MFEDLPLGDFGNRIPSLTFEVVADAGAVTRGDIARGAGGAIDGGVRRPRPRLSAYGDTIRSVTDALAMASGAWIAVAVTG